jgi:hypothetical protein
MKLIASILAAFAVTSTGQPVAAAKLDAGIYTNYSFSSDGQEVIFSVCGSAGCYGGGDLESDRACAVMEGKPKQDGNVLTRYIYVFDKRSSVDSPAVVNVYLRTDTFTDTDTIVVKLDQQVQTGLAGAPHANCFMAGSNSNIIVGTDASQVVAEIGKVNLKVSHINGEPSAVQSITADHRGYITVTYLAGGFRTVNPKGDLEGFGGGTYQLANTRNAITNNGLATPR